MNILHISDTHGYFPELVGLDGVDCVVHSGDFCPNRTRGLRVIETSYQEAWLTSQISRIRAWLGGKTLLFCPGNHDYIDICEVLQFYGVDCIDLNEKRVEFGGLTWFGSPYVPFWQGEWNYEVTDWEIEGRLEAAGAGIDVLVSHGPPVGCLDETRDGRWAGSPATRTWINEHQPLAVLCGHIHEAAGSVSLGRTLVSNAACTQRILTLSKDQSV